MNTGLDALKTASKKTVHKSAKTAGEFIGNKIADALAKLIDNKIVKKQSEIDENSRNVEELFHQNWDKKKYTN